MVDQLCQGYHWSFKEAMSLTMPQVIMLGHAAWANHERWKSKSDKEVDSTSKDQSDPIVQVDSKSKRFSEMTSEDYAQYYNF